MGIWCSHTHVDTDLKTEKSVIKKQSPIATQKQLYIPTVSQTISTSSPHNLHPNAVQHTPQNSGRSRDSGTNLQLAPNATVVYYVPKEFNN